MVFQLFRSKFCRRHQKSPRILQSILSRILIKRKEGIKPNINILNPFRIKSYLGKLVAFYVFSISKGKFDEGQKRPTGNVRQFRINRGRRKMTFKVKGRTVLFPANDFQVLPLSMS